MDIFQRYKDAKNEEKAIQMAAYMKNHFLFLGIQKPERTILNKEFIKEKKQDVKIDWAFIEECYKQPYRELHYLAITYLDAMKAKLNENDLLRVKWLITTNSWWDSVDAINPIVGYLFLKFPNVKEEVETLIRAENIWLKRVSIICQLKFKEQTDTTFLAKAITSNTNTKEFFVNKAIGWALREYSKTNKDWVIAFLEQHTLDKLSVREASKYLSR